MQEAQTDDLDIAGHWISGAQMKLRHFANNMGSVAIGLPDV